MKLVTLKKKLSLGLIAALLAGSVSLPTYAAEQPATMQISPWAVGVLNEGERYGLYPLDWYYKAFNSAVSADRLKTILTNTHNKLETMKLQKNKAFKPAAIAKAQSRKGVLTALYNEMGQYDLTGSLALGKEDPIQYMQKNKIILGDEKGLQLDQDCTTEQAAIFATKVIRGMFYNSNQGSEGLLWKATKGSTTVYMLGSIHIGDNSLYPMSQDLMDKFYDSSALYVEANLLNAQEGMAYMQSHSVYTDKTRLKDVISKEAYAEVQKAFAKFNIPEETYSTLKPWTAANTLSVLQMSSAESSADASASANAGVDMYFMTNALLSGMPIVELEGLKFQTDLFDQLSPKLQESNLLASAQAINTTASAKDNKEAALLDNWLDLWKKGDEAGFAKSFSADSEDANSEFSKALFGERDKAMAVKVAGLLDKNDQKTYFVVVGAGHLALNTSVVEILKKQGYTVEAVN